MTKLAAYPAYSACQRGALVGKSLFRMSKPLVAIGFILLASSILGIVLTALMFFGVLAPPAAARNRTPDEEIAAMRAADVPEPLIGPIKDGQDADVEEWLIRRSPATRTKSTPFRDAQYQRHEEMRATGPKTTPGGRFTVATGIASLVGGLLGELLVMRKRVLQCSVCGAVVNAS